MTKYVNYDTLHAEVKNLAIFNRIAICNSPLLIGEKVSLQSMEEAMTIQNQNIFKEIEPNFGKMKRNQFYEKNKMIVKLFLDWVDEGDFIYIKGSESYYDLIGVEWSDDVWEVIPVPVFATIFSLDSDVVRERVSPLANTHIDRYEWDEAQKEQFAPREIKVRPDDNKLGFAKVLPVMAKPWFSIGDEETLRELGTILDSLDFSMKLDEVVTSLEKIASLFREYTSRKAEKVSYTPGTWDIGMAIRGSGAPIIKLTLTATCGRKVKIEAGQGYTNEVIVDFKGPSWDSSSTILRGLDEVGIKTRFIRSKKDYYP